MNGASALGLCTGPRIRGGGLASRSACCAVRLRANPATIPEAAVSFHRGSALPRR